MFIAKQTTSATKPRTTSSQAKSKTSTTSSPDSSKTFAGFDVDTPEKAAIVKRITTQAVTKEPERIVTTPSPVITTTVTPSPFTPSPRAPLVPDTGELVPGGRGAPVPGYTLEDAYSPEFAGGERATYEHTLQLIEETPGGGMVQREAVVGKLEAEGIDRGKAWDIVRRAELYEQAPEKYEKRFDAKIGDPFKPYHSEKILQNIRDRHTALLKTKRELGTEMDDIYYEGYDKALGTWEIGDPYGQQASAGGAWWHISQQDKLRYRDLRQQLEFLDSQIGAIGSQFETSGSVSLGNVRLLKPKKTLTTEKLADLKTFTSPEAHKMVTRDGSLDLAGAIDTGYTDKQLKAFGVSQDSINQARALTELETTGAIQEEYYNPATGVAVPPAMRNTCPGGVCGVRYTMSLEVMAQSDFVKLQTAFPDMTTEDVSAVKLQQKLTDLNVLYTEGGETYIDTTKVGAALSAGITTAQLKSIGVPSDAITQGAFAGVTGGAIAGSVGMSAPSAPTKIQQVAMGITTQVAQLPWMPAMGKFLQKGTGAPLTATEQAIVNRGVPIPSGFNEQSWVQYSDGSRTYFNSRADANTYARNIKAQVASLESKAVPFWKKPVFPVYETGGGIQKRVGFTEAITYPEAQLVGLGIGAAGAGIPAVASRIAGVTSTSRITSALLRPLPEAVRYSQRVNTIMSRFVTMGKVQATTGIAAVVRGAGVEAPQVDLKSYEAVVTATDWDRKKSQDILQTFTDDSGNLQWGAVQQAYGAEGANVLLAKANVERDIQYRPTIEKGIYDQLSPAAKEYYTPTPYAGLEYQDSLIGQYARGTKQTYSPLFASLESKGFGGQIGSGILGYSALPHVSVVRAYPDKGPAAFTQLIPHAGQTLAPTILNWQQSPWYAKAMGIGFFAAPFLPSPTPVMARAYTRVTGKTPPSMAQVVESAKPFGRMTVPVKTGTFDMQPITGRLVPLTRNVNVWTGLKWGRKPVVGISQGRPTFGMRGIRSVPFKDIGYRAKVAGETTEQLWQPVTPLQTAIYKARLGTTAPVLESAKIQSALAASQAYKGKPSPHMNVRNVELPPVKSLSEAGSRAVFVWTSEQGGRIKMTYGSGSIIPQLEKSLARVRGAAGDIDIQSNWTPAGALVQTQRLLEILKKTEGAKNVRISSEFPTLIETRTPTGTWIHAIDMHSAGAGSIFQSPYQSGQAAWGRLHAEVPIKVTTISGKLKLMTISESGARKTGSITQIGGGTVGPQAHRVKDIIDAYYIARSQGVPVKDFARTWGISEAQVNAAIKAGTVFEFTNVAPTPAVPVVPVASPTVSSAPSMMQQFPSPALVSSPSLGISSSIVSPLPSPSPISSIALSSISTTVGPVSPSIVSPVSTSSLPSLPSLPGYASPSLSLAISPPAISPPIVPSPGIPSVPPSPPPSPPSYPPSPPYVPPVPPPTLPLIIPPPFGGLGGGLVTGGAGRMPQDLGYWEFGEFYAGVHPLTGKLVKVRRKKKIRYGDVPRTVIRSRVSGSKVNSDSPYYKREYVV